MRHLISQYVHGPSSQYHTFSSEQYTQARLRKSGLVLCLICNLVEDEKWPEAGEEAYLAQNLEVGRRVEGVDPVELESAEVQHLEH